MEKQQNNSKLDRIRYISLILIFISSLVIILLSTSMLSIHRDIISINKFLASAENIQTNFEQSLKIYTQSTKNIIQYLLQLRPATEEDFIKFISTIEEISDEMKLDLNLQTNGKGETEKTLNYTIEFLGKKSDLFKLIERLESLPYYIKIQDINYAEPSRIPADNKGKAYNITMNISLYTK